MQILLIGGSGFLGQYIAEELLSKNHNVTIFDHSSPKESLKDKIKFIKGDIQNKKKIFQAIKGKQIVYNFAAISDISDAMQDPINTANVNLLGTLNIIEACIRYKIKRFIFASSVYVLSSQGGFYKASKQAAELFIDEYNKTYNLNYTILRYGSIYGRGADSRNGLSRIIKTALKNNIITYGGTKKAVRNFLHAKDAAVASVRILSKNYKNKSILITGSKSIKIINLIKYIKKFLQIDKKVLFKKKPLKGHYDKNPFTYKSKKTKVMKVTSSVSLDQGIKEILEEIK